MDKLVQAVLDGDYTSFNKDFKEKLKEKYTDEVKPIRDEFGKTIMSETVINDGSKKAKCKNCGKELVPGIPIVGGSCPFCGDLLI